MTTTHTVAQGDGLSSLSAQYGFAPEAIWNHPDNAALRRLRSDPNVLYPGDVVAIPDKAVKTEACATDRRHVFRRLGVPARFELQLLTLHRPAAGVAYVLQVDGSEYRGQTDGDGVLRHFVPNRARAGLLRYEIDGKPVEMQIAFGQLDPIDQLTGVQKRLQNLGYRCDDPGVDGPRTRFSLQCFQLAMELDVTGERDAATLDALARLHDSAERFPEPTASAA